MKYKTIDKKAYQLHLIKTERFKTITIRVNLRNKVDKHEISKRNFLVDILNYSTEKYPTRRELVKKTQDLYAVSVYSKSYRIGNYNSISLLANFLNEKYTEDGMLEDSIKLFCEVLFHPNVKNNAFDEEAFQITMNRSKVMIKSLKDNPKYYSLLKMLENMAKSNDKEEVYGYSEYGSLEDLENITRENLYEYYKKILRESLVDVYVIGSFDEKEMEEYLDKYLLFNTIKKDREDLFIEHKSYRKKAQVITEKEDFNQSKLSIGCKVLNLTEREQNYVFSLYNIILGSGPDSKFFKNIREKHSICYYINSTVRKIDQILLIQSGISKDNFKDCVRLIKKEMQDMVDGKISDEEIEAAKKTYITSLDEVYDSPHAIIETYIAKNLLGVGDIEERKKEILTITKKEIIEFSKKVKMDTIYLLEGEVVENEED